MPEHIEGEALEIGAEVAVQPEPPSSTLFRTSDPVEVIEKATRVANALKGVIVSQGLFKTINNKPHVFVEAWTTCGAMLGLTAYCVWSRPIGEPGEHGHDWEARVEVRTLDGRTLAAAEAMCTRKEAKWKQRDDYALRSMAQTRATSKALRIPLGFIVTLAGYSATPAEEMPDTAQRQSDVPVAVVESKPIGDAQAANLILNSDSAGIPRDDLLKAVQHATGGQWAPGWFDDDDSALLVIAKFVPEQEQRVSKWIEKKREKATA